MKLDLILFVDRSGSMSNIAEDMNGGAQSLINSTMETADKFYLSVYRFDDQFEHFTQRTRIKKPIDLIRYVDPRGSTALVDSLCKAIDIQEKTYDALKNKPDKVMFVVITDGQENYSREFTSEDLKKRITKKTEDGWEFIYLGANQDAFAEAGKYGISSNNTASYSASAGGTQAMFASVAGTIQSRVAGNNNINAQDLYNKAIDSQS